MMPRPGWRALAALALMIGLLAARNAACRPCAAEAHLMAAQLEAAGLP